ncbi:electron transfer flavoprotein subunit beta/FixA family protein [Candidatus Neomarinimicrobiota bacterium]
MSYHSIVLVKQVPDTANISGQVMKPDGTVNRGKLPAIFNPEDKVALELALRFRDQYGGKVSVLTMGPPKAAETLRECLYMGADQAYLVTDRKFAGADTLATSYVLAAAIKKIGNYDIIFGGRQAIDGDTAQVGPQTAEKLGLPQITYAEEVLGLEKNKITIKRKIDGGHEILECKLPLLVTVIGGAADVRPFQAKRVMAYKNTKSLMDLEKMVADNSLLYMEDLIDEHKDANLLIETFTTDELDVDVERCGLAGSPTKVHKVESVVLSGGEHESIEASAAGLEHLMDQLANDHIFG